MDYNRTTLTRGQRTRQRIIERAAKVFNQHGYAGTAISELMHATGLCKGAIYRHFTNKEELATEAFRFAWMKASAPRRVDLADGATATEHLHRIVANFVHRPPVDLPGGCPLMNTAVDADDTNPSLLAAARGAFHEWRATLEQAVKMGQRRGELQTSISPCAVATIIIGSLEGALLISRIERNRSALLIAQEHLDTYIGTLASPLRAKHGTRLSPPARSKAAANL